MEWVADAAPISHYCGIGWWLHLRFCPSPGNFHMHLGAALKRKKEKKRKKKGGSDVNEDLTALLALKIGKGRNELRIMASSRSHGHP